MHASIQLKVHSNSRLQVPQQHHCFQHSNHNSDTKNLAYFIFYLFLYWTVQRSWFAQVNALVNLLRKKSREVATSLPGRFLSRCCFTLCITMEAEPRIVKQYKCHHCCSCKKYQGKGMVGGKKSVFASFFLADQKIASSWKKMRLGASYSTSNKLLPVARHIMTTGLQKYL